ncbi:MAG: mechanosensitive ion channel family protein [Planctomycetota bacterium]
MPVVLGNRQLFEVATVLEVSAARRAEEVSKRVTTLAKSHKVKVDALTIRHDDKLGVSLIVCNGELVNSVWQQEAEKLNIPRKELADRRLDSIKEAIQNYRQNYSGRYVMRGVGFTALTTLVLVILIKLINLVCRKEKAFIEKRLTGERTGKFAIIWGNLATINRFVINTVKVIAFATLALVYLNLILSFFPWTAGMAEELFDLVIGPLKKMGLAAINQIPDLCILAVICVITYYALRVIRQLFDYLRDGKIRIRGFYSDWADTTCNLVRLIVIIFATVAAFPYIPGAESPAFKALSLFIGVLFSLGSTSAVANVIAGLILTYMRPFVAGDSVTVSETTGKVVERRMLSTRIRTPKNEMVAIPNSAILGAHIINYSSMATNLKGGLTLHTTITIGYDVPWRQVHELMIQAAKNTEGVLEKPEPFVLQTGLGDYYIAYELNVATDAPDRRPRIYSQLHQNIQDEFAAANVEITSPHYRQVRNINDTTIPPFTRPETTPDNQPG